MARVNWSGVGVGLRTQRPGPPASCARRCGGVLAEPDHAARAAALQAEMARYDGPAERASTCSSGSRPRASRYWGTAPLVTV